uniref:Transporter 1, ATP binding cassette subfamily B member n=1 Tax=Pseudonaja textilis TaxID=8673 RepID=A0A670ZDU8_PSETE
MVRGEKERLLLLSLSAAKSRRRKKWKEAARWPGKGCGASFPPPPPPSLSCIVCNASDASFVFLRTGRGLLPVDIRYFEMDLFWLTGDITSHISSGIDSMSEALSHDLSLLMWYLLRGICYYAMMLWISVPLALFIIVTLPFILLLPKFSGKFYQRLATEVQESLARANEVAMETFQAIPTVRSFANEDGAAQCYEKKFDLSSAHLLVENTSGILQLALKVGVLYYGGYLVTQGKLTSGALVTFVLQEGELSTVLLSYYPSMQKAVGSSEKAFEYMDRTPQIKPSGTLAPTNLEGCMELKDVSFSYGNNGNSLVLKGVSFKLCPGTVTALVGPSGCGKSTVVALLQRFYEPREGQVLLDDEDLNKYEHHFLHQKVALVSQDPVLFARSLGANIAYGLQEQCEEKVIQASQQVGVHRFISTMSHGYDTNAGEAGKQISGGQKQGIALARALIRNPKVLILDDATSALDTDSQKLVRELGQWNSNSPCPHPVSTGRGVEGKGGLMRDLQPQQT